MAASDAPKDDPIPPTIVEIPNDSIAYFKNAEVTLHLRTSTGEPFKIDRDFNFTTPICYIYSEEVELVTSRSFPGKTIQICCNTLLMTGTDDIYTLDVSGTSGNNATPTDQLQSITGQDAGNIFLYIEEYSDEVVKRLRLIANGGNGGAGQMKTKDKDIGGAGGNAGHAGNISLVYSSVPGRLASLILENQQQSWTKAMEKNSGVVINTLDSLAKNGSFPTARVNEFKSALANASKGSADLTIMGNDLRDLLVPADPNDFSAPSVSEATRKLGETLQESVKTIAEATDVPRYDFVDAAKQLGIDIKTFLKDGGTATEDKVAASLHNIRLTSDTNSDMSKAYADVLGELGLMMQHSANVFVGTVCTTSGGQGGLGGFSAPGAAAGEGTRGTDGKSTTPSAQRLFQDSRAVDAETASVYAFPDQCRMVLNQADASYYSGDSKGISHAGTLYERLIKRLSFVEAFDNKDLKAPLKLQTMYESMENEAQITFSALPELRSIYEQAQQRKNQIALNQDMFGHSAKWVPRLAFQFYEDLVDKWIANLKDMEALETKYKAAIQNNTTALEIMQQGIDNSINASAQATERISLLQSNNGVLTTAARQIEVYSPLVKSKKDHLLKQISKIEVDIQEAVTVDPGDVIQAFSTLCMAPNVGTALTEIAGLAYKSYTQVQGSDGAWMKKEYVISQMSTCSGTLASLTEKIQPGKNGDYEVDDPGAAKVLVEQKTLKDLVEKFKSAIPVDAKSTFTQDIDDYVSLIQARNTAVMDYNSGIQLIMQAYSDKSYHTVKKETLGAKVATIPPGLPAIAFWMQKTKNQLRLDIMQRMNYESRAISFWGLQPAQYMNRPCPLMDNSALSGIQQTLSTASETARNTLAASGTGSWPDTKFDPNAYGLFLDLTREQLATLKIPTTDVVTGKDKLKTDRKVYSLIFEIKPDQALFLGRSNVRLHDIRLWLPNAKMTPSVSPDARQNLKIHLTHLGDETIVPMIGAPMSFTHDTVTVQFEYNCAKVKNRKDCLTSNVFSSEGMQNDFNGVGDGKIVDATAPIGPFARWQVWISDQENPGLDLTGVDPDKEGAYLEFRGRNDPGNKM